MSRKVYVLINIDNAVLGVYSSRKTLSNGVDYWMNQRPNQALAYQEHELNYSPEPLGWDWCYIPINSSIDKLSTGGGMIPLQLYWGKNISKGGWDPIPGLNC